MEFRLLWGNHFLFDTCRSLNLVVASLTSNSLLEQNICCIQGWDISDKGHKQPDSVNGQIALAVMRTESQITRLEYAKVQSMSVSDCEAGKGHPPMDIKR
jgi:hypothetical protein